MENVAFVFPGQGSQAVGMLAELAQNHVIIGQTFAQASDALGYDLWDLVANGPAETLNETDKTQPALLTASVAIWRAYQASNKPMPSLLAGHSLGEYSALVCGGVIEFTDAVKLVELRGKLMQQAVPAGSGAMYAIIGLDDDAIAKV
ncbi:MAG: [acyl-carrier-protein] S-malonyltransferase, partial [Shewanella psychromarinicola]